MISPEKHHGFVIHHTPLTSSRHIVHLFTAESGVRKGILRVGRKQPSAYLAPLNHLEFQLKGKEHQNLKSLEQISLRGHAYDLSSGYMGLALLHHWSFLIHKSQPEGHPDPHVFRLLEHMLATLRRDEPVAHLPHRNLYFEIWLLHFCGVLARHPGCVAHALNEIEAAPARDAAIWTPEDDLYPERVFQQRIEPFLEFALKWGALTRLNRALGTLWEHFLAMALKTREALVKQFSERRLL
ncbi:DNA repair protein RecO [Sulfidibacter corallicola]|uniref:DNA repair protein RecO n=1 Tax=Sulfidibacter corallicola TaxID=2818388 RepID=A0A8A4TCH9_SULCO|nr:DNA repair protein RecO [Sulfidibacter corallicola]QTD47636.1 DNA repair protein RecO [Sulfidibacter corallicola]